MTDLSDHEGSSSKSQQPGHEQALIVVIAGGNLAALERLVGELPAARGFAFIVTPTSAPFPLAPSIERLQQLTPLQITPVEDGLAVEADHVYLAGHGQFLSLEGNSLAVRSHDSGSLPLDHLLRSLARDRAARSAAVLLSGIRSDGSVGAAELKAAGALVIMEAPQNAAKASLPEQQLLAKAADLVLPLPRVMGALLGYFQAPHEQSESWSALFDQQTLAPILALLTEATGHDFARYKRSTVSRRIQRRMRVHGLKDPAQYVELLKARPAEAELLFNEMLIGVTSFFRDPESFDTLEKAMDEYLQRLPAQQDLRVWVPACSTGEEAYSLAILLQECLLRANRNQGLKLFATDVDGKAIECARAGRYPVGIAPYVSPERLERYFVQEDDTYRINKETRERIVFAPHNVTSDPPFTHMDLVSCRNLLIYLEPDLQQQVLTVFDYALEPGGLLLLGGSESVSSMQSSFEMVDKKAKLFVHRSTQPRRAALPLDPLWGERPARRDSRLTLRGSARQSSASSAEQLLLSEFAPPSAIIAASGELAYLHGRTGRFLEPPAGAPSTNLFDMAREGLRIELPAAVRAAQSSQQTVVRRGLHMRTNDDVEQVTITVKPLEQPDTLRGLLLVTFAIEERAPERAPSPHSEHTTNLEAELHYVRGTLQGMIEDLESSNEELKSMNEELQSTNEEVQSSNEELSTSREELQSLNEELQTLNEELAHRNSMLSQSNDDMYNLLSSVHVATVFVDPQLNVKRFTAPAKKVFRLRDSDVGRPVSDLVVNLNYQTLVEDAQEVLRTLVFAEHEVQTTDGEWRLMRISPYRTANNIIDGLIITVTDIQGFKDAQLKMERSRALFDDLLATLPMPLLLLDESFRVQAASMEYVRQFGAAEPAPVGKALRDLALAWRHEEVAARLDGLARGEPTPPFRLQGDLGAPLPGDVLVHARRLRPAHAAARFLLVLQPVTVPSLPALNAG
jgi:two-component system, chemotaxis family, CheB/CheR fusion protein